MPMSEYLRGWNITEFQCCHAYKATALPSMVRLRMPSPMYPGFVPNPCCMTPTGTPTTRADLDLPLDFNDPVHGVFSSL